MSTLSNLVIGTAGHIDHGKTSLIRALTGVDLDQAPEERERGITIRLGFIHLDLPSGRRAAFVDVPGHERLVRTMISGATGLDAVLLCVSAMEGVMPQTREHLDILGLLGMQRGVIALTMTDLADEETLELAELDVADMVAGTFLDDAPIIHTSAGETPAGLEDLRRALDALGAPPRPASGTFRLPIDRAFIKQGFGTVVTGTVRTGTLEDGAEVEVQPGGIQARVRGLQVHGGAQGQTHAGQRTALNLAGIERDDLDRGQVVVRRGSLTPTSMVDTILTLLPGTPEIADGQRVRMLIGTAEVLASLSHITPPGDPSAAHFVQLRTERPIVAMAGDRFILRRESPMTTLGGGQVLDAWAPRFRARPGPAPGLVHLDEETSGPDGIRSRSI